MPTVADARLSYTAKSSPQAKAARIATIKASGKKVLMVGDGLNDAPALFSVHVSMAPANAADVGRNAADLVFLRESLWAVPQAAELARAARRLVHQNFAIAVLYNAMALPLAILDDVTPLIAAAAMSLSSVAVVANALRLTRCQPTVRSARESDTLAFASLSPSVGQSA